GDDVVRRHAALAAVVVGHLARLGDVLVDEDEDVRRAQGRDRAAGRRRAQDQETDREPAPPAHGYSPRTRRGKDRPAPGRSRRRVVASPGDSIERIRLAGRVDHTPRTRLRGAEWYPTMMPAPVRVGRLRLRIRCQAASGPDPLPRMPDGRPGPLP